MGQILFNQQVANLADGSECLVLKVTGSIDASTNAELESNFIKWLNNNYTQIVLNLSGLTYISSTGLGVLLRYVQKCRDQGGDIKISQVQPNIWTIFRTVGMNSIFEIFGLDQQAIKRFEEQTEYKQVLHASYPARFKCPGCSAPLEIAQPGKYACPHCSSFFAAEESGSVKSFTSPHTKFIEVRLSGDSEGLDWVKGLIRSQSQWLKFPKETRDNIEQALDKTYHLLVEKLNKSNEINCRFVVVPGKGDLTIGVVDLNRGSYEKNGLEETPEWKSIRKLVDTVEFIPLTPNGYIIKMVKLIK